MLPRLDYSFATVGLVWPQLDYSVATVGLVLPRLGWCCCGWTGVAMVDWRVTRLSVDGVTVFSISPGLLWDCSCRNRSGVRLFTSMGSSGGGMTGGGSALVGSAGRIFGVLESWIS